MNKQEVKARLEAMVKRNTNKEANSYVKGKYAAYKTALDWLNELDEPEKPVIPANVASLIEYQKNHIKKHGRLKSKFSPIEVDRLKFDVRKAVKWEENNWVTYCNAFANDYTVEEKKYHVFDHEGYLLIRKYANRIGRIPADIKPEDYPDWQQENLLLTEKEIKDYDERYWAFAEEVTE